MTTSITRSRRGQAMNYDWREWESGRVPRQEGFVSYDHWKTTEPDIDDAPECSRCGYAIRATRWGTINGEPVCLGCEEIDEAADHGDWECHQRRD